MKSVNMYDVRTSRYIIKIIFAIAYVQYFQNKIRDKNKSHLPLPSADNPIKFRIVVF